MVVAISGRAVAKFGCYIFSALVNPFVQEANKVFDVGLEERMALPRPSVALLSPQQSRTPTTQEKSAQKHNPHATFLRIATVLLRMRDTRRTSCSNFTRRNRNMAARRETV